MIFAPRRGRMNLSFKVNSIQETIPDFKTYENGMFQFNKDVFTATYSLKDTDFSSQSDMEQEDFFKRYSSILNSFDKNSLYKITLFNRNMSYLKTSFMALPTDINDGYDHIRSEYNSMRQKNREQSRGIILEKYLTVSTVRKNKDIAAQYFDRLESDMNKRLTSLGSGITMLGINDRMEILYDFYRTGLEQFYSYDDEEAKESRRSYKDYISPSYLDFKHFDFDISRKYGRVLWVRDWGKSLKVETLNQLMGIKTNMMISVDIIPLSAEEIRKFLDDSEMSSESNVDRWSQRSGAERRQFSVLPLTMRRDREIVDTYNIDVNKRNQKIFFSNVSIVVLAESMEKLDEYTDSIIENGAECGCTIEVLGFQQMDGLNTVLPYGPRFIDNIRDVTTESLATMMPFYSVTLNHVTGIPYGVQEETRMELMIDRRLLPNGNEWVIGVSGCGKSFRVKLTALMEVLLTNGDVMFVDPHGEYTGLVKAIGGVVIRLGGASQDVINAMDMCQGYADGNDIQVKSEQLISLFSSILGREFTSPMKSIMMRCSSMLLSNYEKMEYRGLPPTLTDLHDVIIQQPEPEARKLALLIEPYVFTLKCFCGQTNVDLYSRITCFDLSNLEENMWDAGMTVVMDSIKNRLIVNKSADKPTYIKIDEVGRFLDNPYISRTFESFYAEVRKYGGYITGIIQNANKLLKNPQARNMLSNSEIVVMLRQSSLDVLELKNIYGLSKMQITRLTGATDGCGIIKIANQLVNFNGTIEKGYIYDLANTKPNHDNSVTG